MANFDFLPDAVDRQTDEQRREFADLYSKGAELYKAWHAYAGTIRLSDAFAVWNARSPGDRMSATELDLYSNDFIYERASPEFIANPAEAIKGEPQFKIVPTLERLLRGDESIRSVLNIGCYIGRLDYYLGKTFPDRQFIGIDFFKDIVEANAGLELPNRKIMRGYALDAIEAGEANADLTFFFSTAARIKNAEFRRYLRAIKSRYVVINEPNFALPTGEILNPDDIDPHRSAPTYAYVPHAGDKASGYPPCLTHNYRAIFEGEGYKVLSFRSTHAGAGRIEVVASRD